MPHRKKSSPSLCSIEKLFSSVQLHKCCTENISEHRRETQSSNANRETKHKRCCLRGRSAQVQSYLRFYTGTDSIYTPIPGVIIVQMNLPKSQTRLPLSCTIEETMVNSHPNASIINMRWIRSNEHCFIMLCEITPAHQTKEHYY